MARSAEDPLLQEEPSAEEAPPPVFLGKECGIA